MAKSAIYCVTFKGVLSQPKGTHHYTVYKIEEDDDETPPEMRSEYDVTIRGAFKECNCPGFTYHRSETARGPNHKHFRLVDFYESKVDNEHPFEKAGMFIKMKSNGSMEQVTNPFSSEGLEDDV